jgi:LPS O-antigen subunit length determinant protein (WzzB/FepE family)
MNWIESGLNKSPFVNASDLLYKSSIQQLQCAAYSFDSGEAIYMEELNLQDYFKIIWIRKWIILGVIAVVLAGSLFYSFRLPNEFEARAILQLVDHPGVKSRYFVWSSLGNALQQPLELLQISSPKDLVQLMNLTSEPNASINSQLPAGGTNIDVRIRGTQRPDDLKGLLTAHIAQWKEALQQDLNAQIKQIKDSLQAGRDLIASERDGLFNQARTAIEQREAGLTEERKSILGNLTKIGGSSQILSGANGILSLDLVSQLNATDGELQRLKTETESQFLQLGLGGDSQITDIARSIREYDFYLKDVQLLADSNWNPLYILVEPQASGTPIGPQRKLYALLGIILGVLLGLALAFFIHFMDRQPPKTASKAHL